MEAISALGPDVGTVGDVTASPDAFQGMLELAEQLQPLKEMINGHRAWAKESGYSDDIADRMALTLHDHLFGLVFRQTQNALPAS